MVTFLPRGFGKGLTDDQQKAAAHFGLSGDPQEWTDEQVRKARQVLAEHTGDGPDFIGSVAQGVGVSGQAVHRITDLLTAAEGHLPKETRSKHER